MEINLLNLVTIERLFGVILTLIAYFGSNYLYQRFHRPPLLQPVLISSIVIVLVLKVSDIHYHEYFKGGQLLNYLLGPVIVALAVPLYQHLDKVVRMGMPILMAIGVGGTLTVLVAGGILILFQVDPQLILSVWTKSITTAIAMEVTESLGGIAALAATYVLITGVLGAMIGPTVLNLLNIQDPGIRGTSYGICAHAVGTTKAIEEGEETVAFASIALSLMGIFHGVAIPIIFTIVH